MQAVRKSNSSPEAQSSDLKSNSRLSEVPSKQPIDNSNCDKETSDSQPTEITEQPQKETTGTVKKLQPILKEGGKQNQTQLI